MSWLQDPLKYADRGRTNCGTLFATNGRGSPDTNSLRVRFPDLAFHVLRYLLSLVYGWKMSRNPGNALDHANVVCSRPARKGVVVPGELIPPVIVLGKVGCCPLALRLAKDGPTWLAIPRILDARALSPETPQFNGVIPCKM